MRDGDENELVNALMLKRTRLEGIRGFSVEAAPEARKDARK